jgi:hypothetical protein
MDIRLIPVAKVLHIFRSKRLTDDVFYVRVHENLQVVKSVPSRTGHVTIVGLSPSLLRPDGQSRFAGVASGLPSSPRNPEDWRFFNAPVPPL